VCDVSRTGDRAAAGHENLRKGPGHDDGPYGHGDDEAGDLIAGERDEAREESDRRKRVGRQNHESQRRPLTTANTEAESDGIADHRRAAELVNERVVPGQTREAAERSRKDVQRQAEADRAHQREGEDRALERA